MKKFLIFSLAFIASNLFAQKITTQTTVQGSMGKLSVIVEQPTLKEGQKCPVVIQMHGFCGNKGGMHELIANKLVNSKVASVRFDFNGHGESEGLFQNMTVPNEIEDAKAIYEYVSSLPFVSKIGFLGHSQGGVVASMAAGELGDDKVSALVLMAPAAVLREDAIRGNTFGKVYDPLTLTEDVELFGGLKLGKNYIKTAFSLPIYETAAGYQGPAAIFHGNNDKVVPYTYGERYHKIYPLSEYHYLPGEDHGFSPRWPMLLNSSEAKQHLSFLHRHQRARLSHWPTTRGSTSLSTSGHHGVATVVAKFLRSRSYILSLATGRSERNSSQ